MSQALSTIHSISGLLTTSSTSSKATRTPSPCLNVQKSSVDSPPTIALSSNVPRRNLIAVGIASAVLGLSNGAKNDNAWAAGRRTPAAAPTTDEEKKDPNISGVQAKVLASKKRKEAMKQAMQKQRERGNKIIDDGSSNKKTQESSDDKESSSLDSSQPSQVEFQP